MNNLLMALSLLEQKQLQYKQAGYTLSFEWPFKLFILSSVGLLFIVNSSPQIAHLLTLNNCLKYSKSYSFTLSVVSLF
jgi:hypothetical protein